MVWSSPVLPGSNQPAVLERKHEGGEVADCPQRVDFARYQAAHNRTSRRASQNAPDTHCGANLTMSSLHHRGYFFRRRETPAPRREIEAVDMHVIINRLLPSIQ